jgi:hypothetical protein
MKIFSLQLLIRLDSDHGRGRCFLGLTIFKLVLKIVVKSFTSEGGWRVIYQVIIKSMIHSNWQTICHWLSDEAINAEGLPAHLTSAEKRVLLRRIMHSCHNGHKNFDDSCVVFLIRFEKIWKYHNVMLRSSDRWKSPWTFFGDSILPSGFWFLGYRPRYNCSEDNYLILGECLSQ